MKSIKNVVRITALVFVVVFMCACSGAETGNVDVGETEVGEVEVGEVETGDIEVGDIDVDDIETGDVEVGEIEVGDIDSGNFVENEGDISESYRIVNDNVPEFSKDDMTADSFEIYSDLDSLGRCGVAYANICGELMPTEERGEIGSVRPSGWHTVKYNDIIEGNYLYNRCHLIGYQLAGENANEKNLITGTRYMNVQGMLPFENMVADYVEETGNHVLYRVTPIYEDDNLVASGVQMEAMSVEDDGAGITFNVFVYNIQPGIVIDYKTGESHRDENWLPEEENDSADDVNDESSVSDASDEKYILNINTMKFHRPICSSVSDIADYNKEESLGNRSEIVKKGYSPCKKCRP